MSITMLASYNPVAEELYTDLHTKLCALWRHAAKEPDMEKRSEIKKVCFETVRGMRRTRLSSYETPADYAPLLLNKVRERAMRRGIPDVLLPEPAKFKTLKDLLNFAAKSEDYIQAHIRRQRIINQWKYELGLNPTYRRGYTSWMTINPSAMRA